jgi:hypothetical protein
MLIYVYVSLHLNYLLFMSDSNNCWILSKYLGILLKSNFIETHPMTAELFSVDTKTDEQANMTILSILLQIVLKAPLKIFKYST